MAKQHIAFPEHISFRFSRADQANLVAIAAALADPVTRPNVSVSETLRASLRIAAASLKPVTAAGVA